VHPLAIVMRSGISSGIHVAAPKRAKTVKKGISFPEDVYEDLLPRSKALGYPSFSAYIVALGHKDLHTPGGWLSIPPKRAKK